MIGVCVYLILLPSHIILLQNGTLEALQQGRIDVQVLADLILWIQILQCRQVLNLLVDLCDLLVCQVVALIKDTAGRGVRRDGAVELLCLSWRWKAEVVWRRSLECG